MAENAQSCHEWILACPPWPLREFVPSASASTSSYTPTSPPPEWRPFALVHARQLAEDMIRDLPAVLQTYPDAAATRIMNRWRAIIEDAEMSDSDSEETGVTVYWAEIFHFLKRLSRELGCRLSKRFQIPDDRAGVRMDWSLALDHEDKIGGEAKTETVLQQHSAEMEAQSQVPWLGWEHRFDTASGGRAIILKLAMWLAAKNLRWGIVGSERQYRIIRREFRLLPSNELRPFLLMSNAISIDSPTLPVIKLVLYMLFTGRQNMPHLQAPYNVAVPLRDPMTLEATRSKTQKLISSLTSTSKRSSPGNNNSSSTGGATARAHAMVEFCAVEKTVSRFLLDWGPEAGTGLNVDFVRVMPKISSAVLEAGGRQRCRKAPPGALAKLAQRVAAGATAVATGTGRFWLARAKVVLYAFEPLGWGSTGSCWRGIMGRPGAGDAAVAVAIKLAWNPLNADELHREAAIYTYLLPLAQGVRRPQFYGYFHGGTRHAIVLQYTGEAISSYDELSVAEKLDLLAQVELLHKSGIEHGDVAPRNVTRNAHDNRLWLVDFSCSRRHVHCGGRDCVELASLRRSLCLPDNV